MRTVASPRAFILLIAAAFALGLGAAHTRAAEPAGNFPITPGDFNCDSAHSGKDPLALAMYLAGLTPSQQFGCPALGATRGVSNGKIAFETYDGDIMVMNADGSDLTNITNTPNVFDEYPAWSPDGTKIAFDSFQNGQNYQLFTANPDGSDMAPVSPSNTTDDQPSWSPDGQRLAFSVFDGNRNYVYVVNLNGSGRQNLTSSHDGDDFSPAWSPDGKRIAFTSQRDGTYGNLYTMKPDGSDVQPLVLNDSYKSDTSWSPDGRKIAYHQVTNGNTDVWVVPSNGGQPVQLTNAVGRDSTPEWSPDGSFIAFSSARRDPSPANCDPCKQDIYRMSPTGANQTAVTDLPTENDEPAWQPVPLVFGDLNCDQVVNAADLMVSLESIAGLPLTLPPACPAP